MPKLILRGAAATALGAVASLVSANGPAPSEAAEIVSKVHSAAARQDYATLRSNMATDFTWSFGGDADAEQALAEWKKHPKYMKGLAKATQSKCGWIDRGIYQCPVKTGLAFRAGFRQIEGRWKLVYFVEGNPGDESLEAVLWLVRHGADTGSKTNRGETALDMAVSYRAPSMIELLRSFNQLGSMHDA